jgi:flagellar biosynthesis/type III secretory pathway M-ring protein FliF/YscJ
MQNCDGCLPLKDIKLELEAKTIEHETIIEGIGNQMHNLESKFDELKTEVNKKIDGIPEMLENALNKLLARVAKWLIIGILLILISIVIAFARPGVSKALGELKMRVDTYQIEKGK